MYFCLPRNSKKKTNNHSQTTTPNKQRQKNTSTVTSSFLKNHRIFKLGQTGWKLSFSSATFPSSRLFVKCVFTRLISRQCLARVNAANTVPVLLALDWKIYECLILVMVRERCRCNDLRGSRALTNDN